MGKRRKKNRMAEKQITVENVTEGKKVREKLELLKDRYMRREKK